MKSLVLHQIPKLFLLVSVLLLSAEVSFSQSISGTPGQATRHAVVNFQQIATAAAVGNIAVTRPERIYPPEVELPAHLPVPSTAPLPKDHRITPFTNSPRSVNTSPPPPLGISFNALGDNNTSIPPDVQGAVGPNHVMTTLNSQIRIQDKTGAIISTVNSNLFWASLGHPDTFDPRILYDSYTNHWVYVSDANPVSSASEILIAVSVNDNPTGSWNLFAVDLDATNLKWGDYPCVGINKDWIVVQVNMYTMANTFANSNIYVFKKSDLYADVGATHTLLTLDMSYGGTQVPAHTYDNSISTIYMMQDWNGNSAGTGYLRLYTITGAVGSEIVTPGAFIPTANPWQSNSSGSDNFAPQLGTAQKINANDSRIQYLVYRNGSLWTTQTVFMPDVGTTTRSSIQWWEISTAGAIVQRSRVDDPTNTNFYAFPSIAVNSNDDVVLGYSKFSASMYASAYYTYRSTADPANTMRDESVLKAGENTYYKTFGGIENRWGDYTKTCIDPSNDVDIWSLGQYAATPANRWGTWWGRVATPVVPFSGASMPDYRNDNASSTAISLGFTFTLFGTTYSQVYVNNNGNVTFGSGEASGNPTTFPAVSATPMIAPFWADVDTREASSGLVYYTQTPTSLTIIWNGVGYNNMHSDLKNTFTLILTNGSDASIGVGNNVRFSYGDLQWTTGDASGGSGGFGGTAATVGINKGDGSASILLGRFSALASVNFLDNKQFTYDVSSAASLASWQVRYDNSIKKAEDMGFAIPTAAKKLSHSLAVDAAGNSYVTGFSDGGSASKFDYATSKIDPYGNKFWTSRYNNSSVNKDDKAYAVAADANGNVYVTGESDGGANKIDALTVKYNSFGVQQWTARYNNGAINKRDAGYAIGVSPAGDVVYIAGETDDGATKTDFLVVAYDAVTGAQLWFATYNSASNKIDKAYALAVDAAGNVVVTGESDGGVTKIDYATVKYTGGASGGAVVAGWPQRYNSSNKKDYPFAITTDASNNVYVTGGSEGATGSDYATVKYNSAGVQQWASRYNNTSANKADVAYAIALDASNNVYVTGASEGSASKYDYATLKYDGAGVQQWVKRYNGGKIDIARSIAVSNSESAVFVTGGSEKTGAAKFDFITLRYAMSDGTQSWVGDYNGTASKIDVAYNIATASSNSALIVAGTSDGGTTKLDLLTLHGAPSAALPFALTQSDFSSLLEEQKPVATSLYNNYPNPFNPSTTLSFVLSATSPVTLKVYNMLGQEIAVLLNGVSMEMGEHQITFDANQYPSGVYFYRLQTNTFSDIKKMILIR